MVNIKKVAVAGAGLVGRLLAFQLVQRGYEVHVYDPVPGPQDPSVYEHEGISSPPHAAAWTAAGMLSPVSELESGDAGVYQLGMRSLELWPQIVASLSLPVVHAQQGSLMLAHQGDEGSAQRMTDLLVYKLRQAGQAQNAEALQQRIKRISMEELAQLEPSLSGVQQAWMLPGEGQIHTRQAMVALADAAEKQGVHWHWGERVTRMEAGALHTEDGQRIEADWVFDARGLEARPELPVRGVRGEVLWLHAPGVVLNRPLRLLHPRYRVYIVPRPGDVVFIGASEIESEDRGPMSVRSAVELMAAAHSILPELAEARIVHMETNLRPALPNNLPLIRTEDGISRINGLFRHGWLMAPAMVQDAQQAFQAFESH